MSATKLTVGCDTAESVCRAHQRLAEGNCVACLARRDSVERGIWYRLVGSDVQFQAYWVSVVNRCLGTGENHSSCHRDGVRTPFWPIKAYL